VGARSGEEIAHDLGGFATAWAKGRSSGSSAPPRGRPGVYPSPV